MIGGDVDVVVGRKTVGVIPSGGYTEGVMAVVGSDVQVGGRVTGFQSMVGVGERRSPSLRKRVAIQLIEKTIRIKRLIRIRGINLILENKEALLGV
jgi:hypothetical protein